MNRYFRHQNLFTDNQFESIKKSKIMVAGAGGLGCTVMQLITRLGINTLHIYDNTQVDLPDLNRQLLYDDNDITQNKVECAIRKLSIINRDVHLVAHIEKIDEHTRLPDIDLVFDCLDNFHSRFILDKMLYQQGIPMIHGGVSKYYAQVTSIIPKQSKSLSELFPINDIEVDKKLEKDIFPPLVTITASIQVSEGIKYLTGQFNKMLINRVLMIDVQNNTFETIEFM